jgi:hypothetical protein
MQMNHTNQTASAPTTAAYLVLSHSDLIRVSGFRKSSEISVGTLRGYACERSQSAAAVIKRAFGFGHRIAPWTHQKVSCLDADYAGKQDALDAKAALLASAPMVEAEQVVEIEGHLFKVKVSGECYSDPVEFIPMDSTAFRKAMKAEAALANDEADNS